MSVQSVADFASMNIVYVPAGTVFAADLQRDLGLQLRRDVGARTPHRRAGEQRLAVVRAAAPQAPTLSDAAARM